MITILEMETVLPYIFIDYAQHKYEQLGVKVYNKLNNNIKFLENNSLFSIGEFLDWYYVFHKVYLYMYICVYIFFLYLFLV